MRPLARRIAKTFAWLLFIYLLLGLLIWALSPIVVRKVSNTFLEAHGVQTTADTLVRLNPFTSTIVVRNCALRKDDKAHLAIDELKLVYRFWPLPGKSIVIEELSLSGAKLDIQQFKDRIVVGGISRMHSDATPEGTQPQAETASIPSFALAVHKLVFENFEITYSNENQLHSAIIENLTIEKFTHANGETAGSVDLLLDIADGKINFSATIDAARDLTEIQTEFVSENIKLAKFSSWLPENPQLQAATLNLGFKLNAELQNTKQNIAFSEIKFKLEHQESDNTLLLFTAESLNIPQIIQTENTTSIDKIDFARPVLDFAFDSSPSAEVTPTEVSETETPFESPQTEPAIVSTKDNNQSNLKINTILFSKPGEMTLRDRNPASQYTQKITIETLEINNIDTSDPAAISQFKLAGKNDDYFKFDFEGDIRLLAENVNLHLLGSFQELSVPPLNYYSDQALGFGVERGQLASDVDVQVIEDKLGGTVALHLKGVKFSSNDEADEFSAINQSAMPLNIALGYLKDSNDNIELKVPLFGDVNDPGFGTQYITSLIVKKAVMNQAKNYLINTFLPYANVISVAMVAGEQALKVRFEDLAYETGQIEISKGQQPYIDQLTALLNKKKDLRIHACAYATNTEGQNKEERRQLSNERGRAFKKHLIEQKLISSDRILQCEPKIDIRENAVPRVEIGE